MIRHHLIPAHAMLTMTDIRRPHKNHRTIKLIPGMIESVRGQPATVLVRLMDSAQPLEVTPRMSINHDNQEPVALVVPKSAAEFTTWASGRRKSRFAQCGSHHPRELVHAEGLHEERPPRLLKITEPVARHADDLQSRTKHAHTLGKLAAVHQGHADVHQEQVDVPGPILAYPDGFAGIHSRQDDTSQGFKSTLAPMGRSSGHRRPLRWSAPAARMIARRMVCSRTMDRAHASSFTPHRMFRFHTCAVSLGLKDRAG